MNGRRVSLLCCPHCAIPLLFRPRPRVQNCCAIRLLSPIVLSSRLLLSLSVRASFLPKTLTALSACPPANFVPVPESNRLPMRRTAKTKLRLSQGPPRKRCIPPPVERDSSTGSSPP